MDLDTKLCYNEARKLCYEAVYRDGMDKEALKRLFKFSMRYGEITHSKALLGKLSELGVDARDRYYDVESYCGICQSVSDMIKKDGFDMLEMCIGTAKAGLIFSERSLFLRVAIVKCLVKLTRLTEAKEYCYELVRDTPNYVPAIVQEGVINFVEGRFEESLTIFQRANHLDPGNPDVISTKTVEEKAGMFVSLIKKVDTEFEKERYEEAIGTLTSLIEMALDANEFSIGYEFLVPWYNSRAKCFEATNQLAKWFDDCLTSLNIKRTTEAEDLLGMYFTRKRELQLEQVSKASFKNSMNEYQSTDQQTTSTSWKTSKIKFKMNWKAQNKLPVPLT